MIKQIKNSPDGYYSMTVDDEEGNEKEYFFNYELSYNFALCVLEQIGYKMTDNDRKFVDIADRTGILKEGIK